jgi:hypothetical protein
VVALGAPHHLSVLSCRLGMEKSKINFGTWDYSPTRKLASRTLRRQYKKKHMIHSGLGWMGFSSALAFPGLASASFTAGAVAVAAAVLIDGDRGDESHGASR